MVRDKIILQVFEPTDWVNLIVLVENPKLGKVTICLNLKVLNEAICRPHFKMSMLNDI